MSMPDLRYGVKGHGNGFRARFTRQGKIAPERNLKNVPTGWEILQVNCSLKNICVKALSALV